MKIISSWLLRLLVQSGIIFCCVFLLTGSFFQSWAGSRIIIEESQRPESYPYNLVRHTQKMLIQKGYDPGPIDGLWGPRTRGAVIKYQQNFGIPVTGKIDMPTKDHLFKTQWWHRDLKFLSIEGTESTCQRKQRHASCVENRYIITQKNAGIVTVFRTGAGTSVSALLS